MNGAVNLYIAKDTYPSSAYYEEVIRAVPNRHGVMYLSQPIMQDEDGVIFCNIEGDNQTETNVSIGVDPGGEPFYVCLDVVIFPFLSLKMRRKNICVFILSANLCNGFKRELL